MGKNRKHDIVKSSKYKTSMCSFYVSPEGCPYGDQCAFAHGAGELRYEAENTKSKDNIEIIKEAVSNSTEFILKNIENSLYSNEKVADCSVDGVIDKEKKMSQNKVITDNSSKYSKDLLKSDTSNAVIAAVTITQKSVLTSKEADFLIEGYGVKGIKPPPKITKGRCTFQNRTKSKNINNKSKLGENNNNNRRRIVDQYHCNVKNGFVEQGGTPGCLTHFSQLPPGAVLLPYPEVSPTYMSSIGIPHSGVPQIMCFTDCGNQVTNTPFLTTFQPNSINNGEGFCSLDRVPFGQFVSCNNTNGNFNCISLGNPGIITHEQQLQQQPQQLLHQHNLNQQQQACNVTFTTFSSNSTPSTSIQVPITTIPSHHDSTWCNMHEYGLPSTETKEENVQIKCNINSLDENDFSKTNCCSDLLNNSEDELNAWKAASEWNQVFKRWIQTQKDDHDLDSFDSETPDHTEDKCVLRCCMLQVQAEDSQPVHSYSIDNVTEMFKDSEIGMTKENIHNEIKIQQESTTSSSTSNLSCEDRVSSDVCIGNERLPDVDVGEGGNTSSGTNSEVNRSEAYPPQNNCSGCRCCMPHLFPRRRPIVINHFRSSCAAAGSTTYDYCAEYQVVKNEETGKEETTFRSTTKSSTVQLDYVEYYI